MRQMTREGVLPAAVVARKPGIDEPETPARLSEKIVDSPIGWCRRGVNRFSRGDAGDYPARFSREIPVVWPRQQRDTSGIALARCREIWERIGTDEPLLSHRH